MRVLHGVLQNCMCNIVQFYVSRDARFRLQRDPDKGKPTNTGSQQARRAVLPRTQAVFMRKHCVECRTLSRRSCGT